MASRRRGKQSNTEGLGCLLLFVICLLLFVISGVISLFDTYPWLWDALYGSLGLIVLGVVVRIIRAALPSVTNAWQRHAASREQQRQLEEGRRQDRVRAEMVAWKNKQRLEQQRRALEEKRAELLRVLTLVTVAKPAREAERKRREEAKRRKLKEEEKQREEAARQRREELRRRKEEEERREAERREELKRKQEEAEKRVAEEHRKRMEELQRSEAARRKRDEEARERRKQKKEEEKVRFKRMIRENAFIDKLNRMSGYEFEIFMADFFRTRGYSKVVMTPRSGDQGVDLLLTTEDGTIAVQLKRQANPVGNKAVHEAQFGMLFYDADEAWVVTTSSFTPKAREAAKKVGVALYGGQHLRQWFHESDDEE